VPGVSDGQDRVETGCDLHVTRRRFGVELDARGADGQPSAGRHRVARVDDEVHQYLLDLARLGENRARILVLRAQINRHVFADEATDHRLGLAHHLAEDERLRLERLLTAEGE